MCQQGVRLRVAAGHRLQRRGIAAGHQGVQGEAVGMPFHEVADLAADGPGCAKQGEAPG
jgi:hypothetical protein